MRRNRMSTQEYLKALEKDRQNLTDFLSYELQDPRRQRGTPDSVFRTWRISFEYIMQTEPATAQLLSLAAMLSPRQISAKILRRSIERDIDFWTALGTLKGYQLITNELETDNFTIHPLVQASLQYWLEQKHQKALYASKALNLLAEEFSTGEQENKNTSELLLAHAEVVLSYCCTSEDKIHRATLLHNLGLFKWSLGKYDDAYLKISEAYDICQSLDESSAVATKSLSLLACVLLDQGRYEAAEEMNRRALQRQEETLGSDHPHTLVSISNLASILRYQSKYGAAEEMNRRVLQIRERTLGSEHPATITSINNLALVLKYQGKYEAAEEMSGQAVRGYEKSLGIDHPRTLTVFSNLASVLRDQGKYEAAEEINRRVLQVQESTLGLEHPSTLNSVNDLALILQGQGRYETAEEMSRRAVQGYKKALGVDHPSTLMTINNLAFILRLRGKYDATEEMN